MTGLLVRVPLRRAAGLALVAALAFDLADPLPANAQEARISAADSIRPLALDEALGLAGVASEAVRIAEAGVLRARGDQIRARSQFFPQIHGSLGYTRTLRSQFDVVGSGEGPVGPPAPPGPCDQYLAPGGTVDERLAGLEQAQRCAAAFNPFAAFENLPFGQPNEYTLGLQLSQPLFSGGRLRALSRGAAAGRRAAEVGLTSAQAQLILDVAEAYYDASLADRLLVIAEASLEQTEEAFRQTALARQVGNTSEFDLLRAQVTRDNQRPVVIERRTQRELAHLRLRQLVGISGAGPLDLTTDIQDLAPIPGVRLAVDDIVGRAAMAADISVDARAAVRQLEANAEAQREALTIVRAQRLPQVNLTSQYGRVAYPGGGLPRSGEFLTNWTIGVALQVPLFTGGWLRGEEMVAQANLVESRQQLAQVRELAVLDAQATIARLEQAEAAWLASAGTAEQATRAYSIAEVRYREGISTQLELSESRVLLQQAMANRAQAARNLQVARIRLALLPDLPLGDAPAGVAQPMQWQQQPTQRPLPSSNTAGRFTQAAAGGGMNP
ncbi:MAG TPA: TolC family protein [Gemmatimonadaceae bacterium]|nr:TolC family protein [Gemmatimonadaceae bacterium]